MKAILYYTDGNEYTLKANDIFVFEMSPNSVCFELTKESKLIDKCIKVCNTERVVVPKPLLLGYALQGKDGVERELEVVAFSEDLNIKIGRKK